MGIGRWYPERSNLDQEADRLAALPLGADAGIGREDLLDLIAEVGLVRSRLVLAEQQAASFRARLEEAGLLPRR